MRWEGQVEGDGTQLTKLNWTAWQRVCYSERVGDWFENSRAESRNQD